MALGKKTGGRKEGTPNKQRRPKRATEEREAAKNALVNTARGLLDHPPDRHGDASAGQGAYDRG